MLSRMGRIIKDCNPASYTGVLTHSLAWLTAGGEERVYKNTQYDEKRATIEEPIDIYCVHGTADRAGAFKKIVKRLLKTDLPTNIRYIYLVSFEGRFQGNSIEFFSHQLLAKIQANKSGVVDLIGHSRGGLVNAWFAENLAIENNIRVRKQFGLGTPYSGSDLALPILAEFSMSVEEMKPDNRFLTDLQEQILVSKSQYYFVVGGDDIIVRDGRSHIPAYVEQHPESLIKLQTTHGHLSMMTSEKLVYQINAILRMSPIGTVKPAIMFHPIADIEPIPDYKPPASQAASSSATPDEREDDDDTMSLFAPW
ncbi:esterase/lipase family protein [Legionella sp. CNM-4043-24]|uniref:esterase/lipase family protein n=1 Tax=Legionella sp. CNM-4043-24 TaxID=3421646 RepID=UPI00403B2A7A